MLRRCGALFRRSHSSGARRGCFNPRTACGRATRRPGLLELSGTELVATDCPLTWHGITLYGVFDVGAGWVSHGLPENGYNYEGESLVNRNGNHSQFLIAPNNLSQTGIGIKAKEEFVRGWAVVFNASTGINPQSGLLANMAATNTAQARRPLLLRQQRRADRGWPVHLTDRVQRQLAVRAAHHCFTAVGMERRQAGAGPGAAQPGTVLPQAEPDQRAGRDPEDRSERDGGREGTRHAQAVVFEICGIAECRIVGGICARQVQPAVGRPIGCSARMAKRSPTTFSQFSHGRTVTPR